MRERIGKIATDAAAAVDYRGAGTIEGMQVGDEYFFLEMNTRVQVEHCVTEMVTGIDIVREQVRVAAGEELSIKQEDVRIYGHAIECRINAEAAHKNFAPAPGPIESYIEPSGPGVRVDSGLEAGSEVTPLYDPMVAKLITWDVDREKATRRMLRALDEYRIEPLTTLIPFHKAVMASEEWARGFDLPREDRRQEVAEDACARSARQARRGRGGGADVRAHLPGRGQRPAPLGQGHRRRGSGRRRCAAAPAQSARPSARRRPAAAAPQRATTSSRRSRARCSR